MTPEGDELVVLSLPAWVAAEFARIAAAQWSGQLQVDIKEGSIEQLGFLTRRRKPKGAGQARR